MNYPELEFQPHCPMKISVTGSLYEDIKDLSAGDLALFIERDLKGFAKENSELIHSIEVAGSETAHSGQYKIAVSIVGENYCSYSLVTTEIEHILWSYNKQVLTQSNGQFYSVYNHFIFSIDFERGPSGEIKKAS